MILRISLGKVETSPDIHPDGLPGTVVGLVNAGVDYRIKFTKTSSEIVKLSMGGVTTYSFGFQPFNNTIIEDRKCVSSGDFIISDNRVIPSILGVEVYELGWNVPLINQPEGLLNSKVTVSKFEDLSGLVKKYLSELTFYGDGYDYLLPLLGYEDVPCLVEYQCSEYNGWDTLFEGLVKSDDFKINLQQCTITCGIQSTQITDLIQTNASLGVPSRVDFPKTGGAIPNSTQEVLLSNLAYMFDMAGGLYTTTFPQRFWRFSQVITDIITQLTNGNCKVFVDPELGSLGFLQGSTSIGFNAFWEITLKDLISNISVVYPLTITETVGFNGVTTVNVFKTANALKVSGQLNLGLGQWNEKSQNKETFYSKVTVGYNSNRNQLVDIDGSATLIISDTNFVEVDELRSETNKTTTETLIRTTDWKQNSYYPQRFLDKIKGDNIIIEYTWYCFLNFAFGDPPGSLLTNVYYAIQTFNVDTGLYEYNDEYTLPNIVQNQVNVLDGSPYTTKGLSYTNNDPLIPSQRFVYTFEKRMTTAQFFALENSLIDIQYNTLIGRLVEMEFDLKTHIAQFKITAG
jgi:hypothetical protein